MNLSVGNILWDMLPLKKKDFEVVCGVFWGVFYNSFSQLFTKI